MNIKVIPKPARSKCLRPHFVQTSALQISNVYYSLSESPNNFTSKIYADAEIFENSVEKFSIDDTDKLLTNNPLLFRWSYIGLLDTEI